MGIASGDGYICPMNLRFPTVSSLRPWGKGPMIACVASLVFGGCAPIAQVSRPLPVSEEVGTKAVEKTVQNLGIEYKLGPLDGFIRASQWFSDSTIEFQGADAMVETPSRSVINPTGSMGVLTVVRQADGTSQLAVAVAARQGADAGAQAEFLQAAVRQQIEIDQGKRTRFDNPTKSPTGYVVRTTILPVWGMHYALSGNPLAGPRVRTFSYLGSAGLDVLAGAELAMGLGADDARRRSSLVGSAVTLFVLGRALGYFGLTDISDYNRISGSPYNLAEIAF